MAKLAIVGTGFVGTSLGLALRPSKLFDEISGYDARRGRAQQARRAGGIDEEARSAAAAAAGAAVVLVTAPGAELPAVMGELASGLAAAAIVSETSRWKVPALEAARALPEAADFIGGRPILDQAGSGAEEARAEVFRNAVWCLTPSPRTSAAAIDAMSAVISAAGAQPYFLNPQEHDALSATSELLPAATLASLLTALTSNPAWVDSGRLAADSFDRFAHLVEEVQPSLWHEAAANSAALTRGLDALVGQLLDLRARVEAQDAEGLARDWEATRAAIGRWRRDKRQLEQSTMPPKSELRPNLFGNMAALGRLRGKEQR